MGKLIVLREQAVARIAEGERRRGCTIPPRLLLNGKPIIDGKRAFSEARDARLAERRNFRRLAHSAVKGETPREQVDAIDCLVSFYGKAVPVLIRVLEHSENARVLKRVLEAFVYLKVKKRLHWRISELACNVLTTHKNEGLRVDAALCLVKYGGENAVATLIRVMRRDSRGTVRAACLLALNKIKVGNAGLKREIVNAMEELFQADAETGLEGYAKKVKAAKAK